MLDLVMQKIRVALFLLFLSYPVCSSAETIYFYDKGASHKDIQVLIEQNPVGPQENIKSILIHHTDNESMHLVQIRFREKPHIHKTHDLIITLKRGMGILHIGSQVIPMFEGDTAFIPRNTVHYFENSGEGVAAGIGIFVPAYDGTDMVAAEEGSP